MNIYAEIYLYLALAINALQLALRLAVLGYGTFPITATDGRGETAIKTVLNISFIVWLIACFGWYKLS